MAKDDYFVIAYQILSYLYQCLKKGTDVNPDMLASEGPLMDINKKYWIYIMENLKNEGYIKGILVQHMDNGTFINCLQGCQITPKGIEYLMDNTFLKKAADYIRDVKDIVPFSL